MNSERFQEMFPSRNEQKIVRKVLEVLIKHYNVNVFQISEKLSPNKSQSARISECQGLNRILTDLRVIGVVEYNQDCYSPNTESQEVLNFLNQLYPDTRKQVPAESKKGRYLTLLCGYCGSVISAKGSYKTVTCPICSRQNSIDNTCEVIVTNNNAAEFQSRIKKEKISRKK
jgi:hypothetical protein